MMAESRILLVIGAGNPGTEYAGTRHNAGFMMLDFIAREAGELRGDAAWRKGKNYLVLRIPGMILIKPQTYMNMSGLAARSAMMKYKIGLRDMVVIHDDIDLKPGDVRAKTGGGNAGHNGLKSISQTVGNEYRRIRLGIGRPRDAAAADAALATESIRHAEVHDWVLGKFTPEERVVLEGAFPAAALHLK
jgi:PTH1 family peptidyl-tRNA hydrolase